MGDLNAAQRAWLKSVGADIDVVEAPAASEQPAPRAATMTAGAIEPGAATASAGAGGGGGGNDDGGSGSDADGGGKKGDKGGKGGKGDNGGKDGGKGGGPAKSTNQGRIDQLKAWEKDGTILKGSSKELRDQLADKRDKVLQKLAEDKFDKIDLASKEKPDTGPVSRHVPKPAVGSQIDPDDPSARVRGGPEGTSRETAQATRAQREGDHRLRQLAQGTAQKGQGWQGGSARFQAKAARRA